MNNQATWVEITSEVDWGKVDDFIKGSHNSIIKEMHWSHKEYVNDEIQLVYDGNPDLWLLYQIQNKEYPTIEFVFLSVGECSFDSNCDIEFSVSFDSNKITFSGSQAIKVVAKTLKYKLSGKIHLGSGVIEPPNFIDL